jgi:hypothetical protein
MGSDTVTRTVNRRWYLEPDIGAPARARSHGTSDKTTAQAVLGPEYSLGRLVVLNTALHRVVRHD